jgi:thiamine-monophosphate kinase
MVRAGRGGVSSEFDKIALIERWLTGSEKRAPGIRIGIGDDAAVLSSRGPLVWTIDAQVDNVHFRDDWLAWEDIGYRATQAAISDIAAMGARPLAALASLALPAHFSDAKLERLVRGQAEAAHRSACPLIGGNLARASELSITTTVLGHAKKPLLRSGARPGDELWLIGEVGAAALGLAALERRVRPSRALKSCIARWRRPEPRLAEGLQLRGRARAAIDVSDGLAGDAAHIAAASGVRVLFDESLLLAALPPHLLEGAAELDLDPLTVALRGGEDYALLASGAAARRPRAAVPIGRVERGKGVYLQRGRRHLPLSGSFDHFSMRAPAPRAHAGKKK